MHRNSVSIAAGAGMRTRAALLRLLALLALCLPAAPTFAQTPIGLYRNFVGHIDYQATGNSLRSAPNTANACSLTGSSSATLTGIPAGAGIRAAYLYWAGSGSTTDTNVTLNGASIAADRSFTDTFPFNGFNFVFFSGFADVTSLVSGNGSFTFSGLSVDNGGPYCGSQAVVAGWSLVVVYDHPGEDLRAVNVFDGFELFRADSLTLTVDTYRIPASGINGKLTPISWEGDPQNSGTSGGFGESLLFNGNSLDDGLVPPGSSPTFQQFDGTVNTAGSTTAHGVDVDTYDVSPYLSPGDTSATMTFSSGADLVLLSAEIISFTTDPVVDLVISKTHTGDFNVGATGTYTIVVSNNGPEAEMNPISVVDTLPTGLTFAGAAGTGWSCTASGSNVDCSHPGPLPAGAALPALTLTTNVAAAAAPAATNSASVTSASIDIDPSNDTASDPTTVLASDPPPSTPGSGTKTLYFYDTTTGDPNGFSQGAAPWLSRTPPSSPQNDVTISNFGTPQTWSLTPALQAPLTIDAGTIPVTLFVGRTGGPFFGQRRLRVELSLSGAASGALGSAVEQQFSAPPIGGATELTFAIPLATQTTLPAGTQIHATLTNTTPGLGFPRTVIVLPVFGGEHSRIDLPALTVIDVAATQSWNAPWPAGTATAAFAPASQVSLRADVRDPFGTFDIATVAVDVTDNSGSSIVSGAAMTRVATLDGSTARFEYLLSLPSSANGTWTWRVTANEGTEGIISHQRTASFSVAGALLTLSKSVTVLSDPINGSANPKAVPGAVMLYSITLANSGAASVDADSLSITDALPPETALFVDASSGDPVVFIDGSPGSGLVFDYAAAVAFSNQPDGGAPYDYSPVPDAFGFDPQVTGFVIRPDGTLAGATGGGSPGFTLRYRTRVE